MTRRSLHVAILFILLIWIPAFGLVFAEEWLFETRRGYEVSGTTLLINFVGMASMVFGAFFAQATAPRRPHARPTETGHRALLNVILCFAIIGGILTYLRWRSIGIDPFAFAARSYYEMNVIITEEGDIAKGIVGRLNSLAFVGLLLVLHTYFRKQIGRSRALAYGAAFILLLVSPRRAALFYALLSSLIFWYITKLPPLRRLALPLLGFFAAFVGIFGYTQYSLGKMDVFSISDSLETAFGYVSNNFYVMDALLKTPHFENTWIVLANPARILSQIFDIPVQIDLSIPPMYVPQESNTVTAFYYLYKSSNYFGVTSFGLLVGFGTFRSLRRYFIEQTFLSGALAALFLAGIVLSIRECFFLSYEFMYWVFIVFIAQLYLRKEFSWKRESSSSARPHPRQAVHTQQELRR